MIEVTSNGVYDFNKYNLLVELTFDCRFDMIDWFGITVLEEGVDDFDRAAPYMEQFLNTDGTEKICETWDEPDEETAEKKTRVAFFVEKGHGDMLETPYGNISLTNVSPMPERLKKIIDFE